MVVNSLGTSMILIQEVDAGALLNPSSPSELSTIFSTDSMSPLSESVCIRKLSASLLNNREYKKKKCVIEYYFFFVITSDS